MKRFLITIIMLCSAFVLHADKQDMLIHVQKLFKKAPNREKFVVNITNASGNKISILDQSEKEYPRLYSTLLQAKTSLVFTDQALDEKLYGLELEQNLLTALEQKNLHGALEAIKSGADVNTVTPEGHTALMLAVLKADQPTVEDLLKLKARTAFKGEFVLDDNNPALAEQMSAFELAQNLGYKPIAEVLKKASA